MTPESNPALPLEGQRQRYRANVLVYRTLSIELVAKDAEAAAEIATMLYESSGARYLEEVYSHFDVDTDVVQDTRPQGEAGR